MIYNILFETSWGGFNLMKLDEKKLPIVLAYYENGEDNFTIAGQTYHGEDLQNLKIFTVEKELDLNEFEIYCRQEHIIKKNIVGYYYPEEALILLGKDRTEDFIGDNSYGYKKQAVITTRNNGDFVNSNRLKGLKEISNSKFDFTRLIRLCEEINDNYIRGNFLSVGMIGRTILHHIPPVFNFSNFDEVANNYGGPKENKSFKKNMSHLNDSLKNLAD